MSLGHKYSEDVLASMCLSKQRLHPELSEGAIMALCDLGREHLADRAKNSDLCKEARAKMAAIREKYYIELGVEGCKMGKEFNAVAFIWLTRNILNWRDKAPEDEPKTIEQPQMTITAEGLLTLVKHARSSSDAA